MLHIEPRRVVRMAVVVLAIAVPSGLFSAGLASADDHAPPQLIAHAGQGQQRGRNWSVGWTSPSSEPGTCVTMHGDGIPVFQKKPLTFRAPGTVRIVLHKEQPPDEVQVSAWRKLRREGLRLAKGRPTHPPFILEPVAVDGLITAWQVVLQLNNERHYYIDLYASWPSSDVCGGPQSGNWVFHLEGR